MIVTAVAWAFGGALTIHALYAVVKGRASLRWPSTLGTVTTTLVQTNKSSGLPMHRARVSYRYTVDGVTHTGTTAFYGDQLLIPLAASLERKLEGLRGDGEVRVHYNPAKPGQAVLEPGVHWQAFALAVAGLGFFVWGLFLLGS